MPTTDPRLVERTKAANLAARRHFGVFQWPTVGLAALLVAAEVGILLASLGGPVPVVLAIPVIALLQYPTYICLHEAAHGNIARGRGRLLNEMVGSVLGVVLGAPLVAHRKEHTAHHAYTNREGADPDRIAFSNGRFDLASPVRLFAEQYRFFLAHSWPKATAGERAWFVVDTLVIVALRAWLVAAFGWPAVAFVLAVPIIGLAIIGYLVVYLVHAVPEPLDEGRWVDTASYETDHLPGPVGRLVNWGWMGHHVHGVHHLYPSVPFYRQQQVFEEIRELMVDRGAPVLRLGGAEISR